MKKIKKIPFWAWHEEVKIFVQVKRKRKLSDLYPQRAILEELRRDSQLIQANDWVDHDYYEGLVEQMDEKNTRLMQKYKPKISKKEPVETEVHQVPNYDIQFKLPIVED